MSVHTHHGIRCGNRDQHGEDVVYHASVEAVKDCYAESGRFAESPVPAPHGVPLCGHPEHQPKPLAEVFTPEEQARIAAAEKAMADRRRYAAWRAIPVYSKNKAYYAVRDDGGQVSFFRVERPAKGKHAGKTFLKMQAGSEFYPVHSWPTMVAFLDAIAADPTAAARLYADEIGRCSRCGRTLTDEDSRERGMGPDCAQKWGA